MLNLLKRMFGFLGNKQEVTATQDSTVLQIARDNHGDITIINAPYAQQALAVLVQQLDDEKERLVQSSREERESLVQSSREERESLVHAHSETILGLVNAKQSHSLPDNVVDDALQAIIDTGNTEKAKALLIQQIEVNQGAVKQLAKLYYQKGALSFATDTHAATHAALSDFIRATQLDPDFADAWNEAGHLHRRLGQLDDAIKAYIQMKALGERQQDNGLIAVALGNLGNVYQILGELDKALEMYQKSISIEKELGPKEGMAIQYTNIGIVYQTRGELDKALEMYQQALTINQELGRKEGMAIQYSNIGIVYQASDELDKALEMYQKSFSIEKELGRKEGMAFDYGNMGNVYQIRGELEQARALWQKSLKLFEELGAEPQIKKVQQLLSGLNEASTSAEGSE